MKRSEIEKIILEQGARDLSPELLEQIQGDPELQKTYERVLTVQNLLALKRHETPDAGSVERCVSGVRRQLAHAPEGKSIPFSWWDLVSTPAHPAVRFGLAAVFVALLAANVLTFYKSPSSPTLSSDFETPRATTEEPLLLASTNMPAEEGEMGAGTTAPIFMIASNTHPRYVPSNIRFVGN